MKLFNSDDFSPSWWDYLPDEELLIDVCTSMSTYFRLMRRIGVEQDDAIRRTIKGELRGCGY